MKKFITFLFITCIVIAAGDYYFEYVVARDFFPSNLVTLLTVIAVILFFLYLVYIMRLILDVLHIYKQPKNPEEK